MVNQQKIPIVDFSPVLRYPDDPHQWQLTVQQLDNALSSIGFVYLTNHGVPAASVQAAFSVARSFFTLPVEVKALYTKRFSTVGKGEADGDVSPSDYNGYVPAGDELLDKSSVHEIRESFDVMGAPEGRVYPSTAHVPNFQATVQSLRGHFVQLALKFGQALGVALLGPENVDFFRERLRALVDPSVPGLNQVRLLYYPEIPRSSARAPEEGAGITRCFQHSDYGMFTFLAQDGVGGLEVKGVGGEWVPAPPVEGALLVNTGDLLQFWSGGHYPATVHRVRIPPEPLNDRVHAPTRQSIAFFVNPDDYVNVAPLKTKFSTATATDGQAEAATTGEVNAHDYVMRLIKIAYRIPKAEA